ncbi:hypothetical protein DPMN_054833 [Dreissena polymorpha]|uniref:Uncharacterized protein n=1 Tax=Dreissena polymorpha TaxID=45954 RepID=A0A9D4CRH9_DREPO|nr:hypothetical protein DPMN_054833 [Dreissena polymorpha]
MENVKKWTSLPIDELLLAAHKDLTGGELVWRCPPLPPTSRPVEGMTMLKGVRHDRRGKRWIADDTDDDPDWEPEDDESDKE